MKRALIALALLASCAQPASPAATAPSTHAAAPASAGPQNAEEATAQDACAASRFQNLLGAAADQIDRSTLPANARVIMPGMMVTMDFRADRLNLRVGPDGKVASIGCF